MAPWVPNLLHPNNTALSDQDLEDSDPTYPGRPRAQSRMTSDNLLNHAYGIPALPSQASILRPGHGRSMSHPFPSLFSGKKKRADERIPTGIDSSDDDDDDILGPPSRYENDVTTIRHSEREQNKDLITGKCMTCDSTVRWPKALSVFRCTICLTINDLKPVSDDDVSGSGRFPHGVIKRKPMGDRPQKVPPLSTARISTLIEQCVTFYLAERLKQVESVAGGDDLPSYVYGSRNSEGVFGTDACLAEEHLTTTTTAIVPPIPVSHQPHSQAKAGHGFDNNGDPNTKIYSSSTPVSFQVPTRTRQSSPVKAPQRLPPHPPACPELKIPGPEPNTRQRESSAIEAKRIFKRVEELIVESFTSRECINTSFTSLRPSGPPHAASDDPKLFTTPATVEDNVHSDDTLSGMDAKTLLVGDFAENGSWWTGRRTAKRLPESPGRSRSFGARKPLHTSSTTPDIVNSKSPHIDWFELDEWYRMVIFPGKDWQVQWRTLRGTQDSGSSHSRLSPQLASEIEQAIEEAQVHVQRVLLKATETLLKRPGAPLKRPADIRFLLIVLANPLLYPSHRPSQKNHLPASRSRSGDRGDPRNYINTGQPSRETHTGQMSWKVGANAPGRHSGIIKRVLGLLSNLPNECHHYLVNWFTRFPETHFRRIVELIGSFVTYRLTRQHGKQVAPIIDATAGLIPTMSASGHSSPAALHAALGLSGQPVKRDNDASTPVVYNDDWQIKAAARVMALIFSSNKSGRVKKTGSRMPPSVDPSRSVGAAAPESAHRHGHIVPTSSFYNTLLDYSDLIADFESWEKKKTKFAFCQYPFFLSIWAKIRIMEYDARRQMEVKAREAFFDSIMTRKVIQQYLILNIRRECLVEDSLKAVSQVVGSGGEEIKKGLRIQFKGEEGIDAGGLRKEWFLLLVRDVFNPDHGMFDYDEDSQFCYFNPYSFETSDQFFLVGVVLGLAIYNSTILDVALPPFAFKKLLAAGPPVSQGAMTHAKTTMTYTLEDLAEFRPRLANGLRQLLEYDGDVETTFCRDFVADVERYGQVTQVPLCPDGEKRAVTNANRKEFVDLYIRYLLDTAVARQFEPFKRGFFRVCGGNALSLFQPEEIELLVRGSDEPLDIATLRAVSVCENWGVPDPAQTEPVISWFWRTFHDASPGDQRKLLSFITGSDRIPAMGAANLVIKLSCLGDDIRRYPVARTCFNMLSLWRYDSFERLESMLWRAVNESEGFGLK